MNNEIDQKLPAQLASARARYATLRYAGPTPDFDSLPDLSPSQPANGFRRLAPRLAPSFALAATVIVLVGVAMVGRQPGSTLEPAVGSAPGQLVWSTEPRATIRLVRQPRAEGLGLPTRPSVAFPARPSLPLPPRRSSGFAGDDLG